jgi:uncharacterized membrane protein YfcA
MDLLILVLVVCLVGGGVLWLLNYLAPPDPVRKAIVVLTVIVFILFVLRQLGVAIPNVLPR